jgi:hypothetical protein
VPPPSVMPTAEARIEGEGPPLASRSVVAYRLIKEATGAVLPCRVWVMPSCRHQWAPLTAFSGVLALALPRL